MKTTLLLVTAILLLLSCSSADQEKQPETTTVTEQIADSTTSTSGLETRTVLGGRLSILVPSDFTLMDKGMLDLKYPMQAHRPSEVYTNYEGSINVAFNFTQNRGAMRELPAFREFLQHQFDRPGVEFLNSEIRSINGRDFAVQEFITQAIDSRIYNHMFVTSLDGRWLMCTFNCTINHLDEWRPKAAEIVNSVRVL